MKEFDLSDKELKSLLQEDGIEEPSMGFNQSVLSRIEAYEKSKLEPIRAPKWLIVSLLALFITPAVYMLGMSDFSLSSNFSAIELPSLDLEFNMSSAYLWVTLLTILVVVGAVIFDRFLLKTSDSYR